MKPFKKYLIAIACFLAFATSVSAQSDADAIMIPKDYFCVGFMYDHSSWTNYWEGTFKRSNGNIGTLNTESYMLMTNYGITSKLNVLVTLPYITTNASAGTLQGQQGFQNITATLKWMPVTIKRDKSALRLFGIVTGSIPASNYEANFLPVSIGMHSNTLMLRGIIDYQRNHLFITGSGEYIRRDNITIDQNAYYTTELHYTNQVAIPDATDFAFRGGYRGSRLIAEVVVDNSTTIGGFDIRKNDMPFPSNKMNMTMAGMNFKYSFPGALKGWELTGGGDYVLTGRNVGQSTTFHGGAYYLFNTSKRK